MVTPQNVVTRQVTEAYIQMRRQYKQKIQTWTDNKQFCVKQVAPSQAMQQAVA